MKDDELGWVCERFMAKLRRDFRGHKSEITAHEVIAYTKRFALAYGIKDADLLFALIKRDWMEPIGSNSYAIHYDKMRK